MISAVIDGSDAARFASRVRLVAEMVDSGLPPLVDFHARRLQTRVRANASGRPGPNIVTGDYRRSISVVKEGPTSALVGTNRPQGRRLEFGFYGVDAIGRTYNQPPYPHFQPAIDQTRPEFVSAVATYLRTLS